MNGVLVLLTGMALVHCCYTQTPTKEQCVRYKTSFDAASADLVSETAKKDALKKKIDADTLQKASNDQKEKTAKATVTAAVTAANAAITKLPITTTDKTKTTELDTKVVELNDAITQIKALKAALLASAAATKAKDAFVLQTGNNHKELAAVEKSVTAAKDLKTFYQTQIDTCAATSAPARW